MRQSSSSTPLAARYRRRVEPEDWAPRDLLSAVAGYASQKRGQPELDEKRKQEAESAARQRELEAAYARGVADGEAAGQRRERERLAGVVGALGDAVAGVESVAETWSDSLEQHVAALAVTVARQIMLRESELDPTVLAELVESAVERFPVEHPVRIKLNPRDMSLMNSLKNDGDMPDERVGGRKVEWLVDTEIPAGGCLVEGPKQIVDGRIDVSLERIFRQVADG